MVFYATGAIVGHRLAPYDTLSTLPITLFVTGMAACILPFGYLAKRRGRKAAFMAGTALGMLAGLTAALAVFIAAFELFCLAALMGGAYAAVSLSFRFAAADGVGPERRALALSLVMAGGVAAGVIGPSLIGGSLALWPSYPLVTAFIAQALAAVAAAQVLRRVVIPPVSAQTPSMYRSVRSIARQPGLMRTVFLGCGLLYGNEFFDDGCAALYAYARAFSERINARYSVACDRNVCPRIYYRQAD